MIIARTVLDSAADNPNVTSTINNQKDMSRHHQPREQEEDFELQSTGEEQEPITPRIRSAAKYSSLHPCALAISPNTSHSSNRSSVTSSAAENASSNSPQKYHHQHQSSTSTGAEFLQSSSSCSSLAAVASPHKGIVLFHTDTPYQPTLTLWHHSNHNLHQTNASSVSSAGLSSPTTTPVHLKFNPRGDKLVSSSRENAILIWDVSGHVLSPLMGRIATPSRHGSSTFVTTSSSNTGGTTNRTPSGNHNSAGGGGNDGIINNNTISTTSSSGTDPIPTATGVDSVLVGTANILSTVNSVTTTATTAAAAAAATTSGIGNTANTIIQSNLTSGIMTPTMANTSSSSNTINTNNYQYDGSITSIQWKISKSNNKSSNTTTHDGISSNNNTTIEDDILITTCQDWVGIWDVRHSWSTNRMRPTLRFNCNHSLPQKIMQMRQHQQQTRPPLQLISVTSYNHEIAALDSNGIVHLFDERKTGGCGVTPHESSSSSSSSSSCLGQFQAYTSTGFGIDTFDFYNDSTNDIEKRWLTWGIDQSETGNKIDNIIVDRDEICSVKVWKEGTANSGGDGDDNDNDAMCRSSSGTVLDPDMYWHMGETNDNENHGGGSGAGRNSDASTPMEESHGVYHCTARMEVNGLACARVCPQPFTNGIVTVSTPSYEISTTSVPMQQEEEEEEEDAVLVARQETKPGMWQTDLWQVHEQKQKKDDEVISTDFSLLFHGAQCITSFQSGGSDDEMLKNIVGSEYVGGQLIATELAMTNNGDGRQQQQQINTLSSSSSFRNLPSHEEETKDLLEDTNNGHIELQLCCLGSTGFVTTHAIPEASILRFKDNHHNKDETVVKHGQYIIHKKETKTPTDFKIATTNTNFIGGNKHHSSDPDLLKLTNPQEHRQRPRGQSLTDLELEERAYRNNKDQHQYFDPLQLRFSRGGNNVEGGSLEIAPPDHDISDKEPLRSSQILNDTIAGSARNDDDDDQKDRGVIDESKATRVPCPRLCGATFGMGSGGMIMFHNGEVKKMWNWYRSEFEATRIDTKGGYDDESHADYGVDDDDDVVDPKSSLTSKKDKKENFPRNMWDLKRMNEEAEIAQWGEDNENGDVSEDDQVVSGGDDSDDDDDSDGDYSSSDSDDDSFELPSSNIDSFMSTSAMYNNYFGGPNPTLPLPLDVDPISQSEAMRRRRNTMPGTRERENPLVDPTADCLAPVVYFSRENDDLVLQGQCEELAAGWKLGLWTKPQGAPCIIRRNLQEENNYGRFDECKEGQEIVGNDFSKQSLSELRPSENELFVLEEVKNICIHNEKVANDLGQSDKGDVWNILSKIVENISDCVCDDFDGWNGFAGGALGRDLLQNILRQYEILHDVQMLSTIVCVFSSAKYRSQTTDSENSLLEMLFPEESNRFNACIELYGQMLYGWGQLITRANLNKHLRNLSATSRTAMKEDIDIAECDGWRNPKPRQTSFAEEDGIMFAPCCPRTNCLRPADPETNICNLCDDFAFRCSICTNAVKGQFTVCLSCGHGGHVEHMMSWFANHSVCPTGCGCSCTLNTFETSREINSTSLERRLGAKTLFKQKRSPAGPMVVPHRAIEEFGFGSVPFGADQTHSMMMPKLEI